MINITRKEGWILNPDDKKLNSIVKAIIRNEDSCPCQSTHPKCPCDSYLIKDKCCCNLYVKK